ncbi:hypothetical protein [uncultured Halopseudomonas sp.]|uniref:hypothetical protein n=1 Tax=uncultured Halopseudomonas sp. TaxID=2901193 RepID=UPI0030EBE737|tara:strand:+ start:26116 stop:26718 length:603 start_codon:yes stop_codon:yes gene_type:complete
MSFRPRAGMATLFSLVVIGLFALGSWIMDQREPEPMQWLGRYEQSIWTPLREGELVLASVDAPLGIGRLWMISVEDEPLLVSRYVMQSDDLNWRLQAVITLDAQRTESLVKAQDWQPGMRDQSVSPSVGAALAGQPVERVSLIPSEPVSVQRIIATLGEPDMRMDVSEGNQAWVYGRPGVVVAVSGEEAHSIMFGLQGGR